MKVKRSVAIDKDIYDWVMEKVRRKDYASLSHAVQKGLLELKLKEERDASEKKRQKA